MNKKNNLSLTQKISYAVNRWNGIIIQTNIKPYLDLVKVINSFNFRELSERELKEKSLILRQKACGGVSLDALLPEAFALVKEASRRVLKLEAYDLQIAGGIAMHRGKVIQMDSGEGKTLAAVFPAYLNGLTGKGVLIMTANSYLARRDALWMGGIYRMLGLEADFVIPSKVRRLRKAAYAKDITYVTIEEAGYDYLQDGLVYNADDLITRPFNYVIVDEADFILIDEARIPLVIAEKRVESPGDFNKTAAAALLLEKNTDYTADYDTKTVCLTDPGLKKAQKLLGCPDLYAEENNELLSALNVTLYARSFLKKDIHYILQNSKVQIIDANSGRIGKNRRLPYGVQSALEALCNLEIRQEGAVLAMITVSRFINLFPRRAAMSATAAGSAYDFNTLYRMGVTIIPPNRHSIRIDREDMLFMTRREKYMSLVQTVKAEHEKSRPVLIETGAVRESEYLQNLLQDEGIECAVLNAKNGWEEAGIIENAGAPGAITIAAGMAGRGTDIKLGGKDGTRRNEAASAGGLLVIGTTRFAERRIDRQIAGRAGRQGEPGESVFFISLEDDLFRHYLVRLESAGEGKVLTGPGISKTLKRAQSVISAQRSFEREMLLKYSEIVEKQYGRLRDYRMELLAKSTVKEQEEVDFTLFFLDRTWQEHLEQAARLQQGIHLHSYSGTDPIHVYIQNVHTLLSDRMEQMNLALEAALENRECCRARLLAEKKKRSRDDWAVTYLTDDNPLVCLHYLQIWKEKKRILDERKKWGLVKKLLDNFRGCIKLLFSSPSIGQVESKDRKKMKIE